MTWRFDPLETLTVASVILWCGLFLRSRIFVLKEFSIPAPLIGGVPFALLRWGLMDRIDMIFDMAIKPPLLIIFFTTVGLGASLGFLKKAGPQLLAFLGVASSFVILQNGVALLASLTMGIHPLLGLLAGSVTLSGNHTSGLALAETLTADPRFVEATGWAMAAATFGAIMGSVIGGPVARALILRHRLQPASKSGGLHRPGSGNEGISPLSEEVPETNVDKMLATILQILVAMSSGALICAGLQMAGIVFPPCLAALIVGSILRNAADWTGIFRINTECIDFIGSLSLCLFLAMAIMSLDLSQLIFLAGPLLVILVAETVLMILFSSLVTFPIMGKDFEAAIMAGGHCGMAMGATSNAVANMGALCSRYGPAPRAFFVVPISAGCFIELVNVYVIRLFVNLFQ